MNNINLSDSQQEFVSKSVYIKPVITMVKLVPGESVLAICKIGNPSGRDACQPTVACRTNQPAS